MLLTEIIVFSVWYPKRFEIVFCHEICMQYRINVQCIEKSDSGRFVGFIRITILFYWFMKGEFMKRLFHDFVKSILFFFHGFVKSGFKGNAGYFWMKGYCLGFYRICSLFTNSVKSIWIRHRVLPRGMLFFKKVFDLLHESIFFYENESISITWPWIVLLSLVAKRCIALTPAMECYCPW